MLSVPMDNLKQVMLGIFEDHEDAFRLEDDLDQGDNVVVGKLGTKCHFSYGRLRNTGVAQLSVFVWFESAPNQPEPLQPQAPLDHTF